MIIYILLVHFTRWLCRPFLIFESFYFKIFKVETNFLGNKGNHYWTVHICSVRSNPLQSKDCSPPGSSVHGIFQARILAWVAIFKSVSKIVFIPVIFISILGSSYITHLFNKNFVLFEDTYGIFPIQGSNPCLLYLLHWQVDHLPVFFFVCLFLITCITSL